MQIAYKTEIKPTLEQKLKIQKYMRVGCYIYNQYLNANSMIYHENLTNNNHAPYITADSFFDFLDNNPKFYWLKHYDISMKKRILVNAEQLLKNLEIGEQGFPKFKKFYKHNMKIYVANNLRNKWIIERHRIQIGSLGCFRLKEYGYLPTEEKIIGGNISFTLNKYYITVFVEKSQSLQQSMNTGDSNQNEDWFWLREQVIKLEKRIKREKKRLQRKYDFHKIDASRNTYSNIEKQRIKINKLEHRLSELKKQIQH